MEQNYSEEIENLKHELEETKQQLELAQNEQTYISQNPQDKFIEVLVDKGSKMFEVYMSANAQSQRHALEKEAEYGKQELSVVDNLDRRDKIFKGVLLVICILSLCVLAYFEKAQSVAPVIGVIIGLLLKTSSISDFFANGKKRVGASDDED